MKRQIIRWIAPPLIGITLWTGVSRAITHIRQVSFPSPFDTAKRLLELAFGQELSDTSIYHHIFDTLYRWGIGFSLAVILGICYGLLAARWRLIEDTTRRLVEGIQIIPGLAWIPIALLLFGIGEMATIFMITVSAFPAMALSVFSGVKQIDGTYIRAARMLGAGERTLFFKILFPGALPAIVSGFRISMGTAWRILLAAEMIVGTGTGLGYAIVESRWSLEYVDAFACLVIIAAIGSAVEYGLLRQIEHRIHRYYQLEDGLH